MRDHCEARQRPEWARGRSKQGRQKPEVGRCDGPKEDREIEIERKKERSEGSRERLEWVKKVRQ